MRWSVTFSNQFRKQTARSIKLLFGPGCASLFLNILEKVDVPDLAWTVFFLEILENIFRVLEGPDGHLVFF